MVSLSSREREREREVQCELNKVGETYVQGGSRDGRWWGQKQSSCWVTDHMQTEKEKTIQQEGQNPQPNMQIRARACQGMRKLQGQRMGEKGIPVYTEFKDWTNNPSICSR